MKSVIEESSVQWWSKWSKQIAELQLLRADAENRLKEGEIFFKLDKKSVVAIKEELADDFLALSNEQMMVIQRLVAQLDDDQLENQVRFERYEFRKGADKKQLKERWQLISVTKRNLRSNYRTS